MVTTGNDVLRLLEKLGNTPDDVGGQRRGGKEGRAAAFSRIREPVVTSGNAQRAANAQREFLADMVTDDGRTVEQVIHPHLEHIGPLQLGEFGRRESER